MVADDFKVLAPSMGEAPGEQYLAAVRMVWDLFAGALKMTIRDVVSEGDTVMVRARSEGPLFTGDTYENDYFFMARFNEAGLITFFVEFFDTLRVQQTLAPAIALWRQGKAGT